MHLLHYSRRYASVAPWFCISFLVLTALLGGCGSRKNLNQKLSTQIENNLAKIQTVEGRLNISLNSVVLQQKFWLQPPDLLRTETEAGPRAFQGTIVVLNAKEGWVYSPSLNMATLVDRSEYTPDLAGDAGAGSMLERMPTAVLDAIRSGDPVHLAGDETVAGRDAIRVEIVVPSDNSAFPAGPLQVWLDDTYSYPLALQDSSGRRLSFTSIQFNATIDPATFVFFPPPGAGVQRVNPKQQTTK